LNPVELGSANGAALPALAPARSETWRHVRYVLAENPLTLVALIGCTSIALTALFGPMLAPYSPLASDTSAALSPPTAAHWFGTDQLGRDILSRVIVATRLDLAIALGAVSLSFAIGSVAGAWAGFRGGLVDRVVSRCADTIMAFPLFVLAMGIVAALGNTVSNIVYATAVVNLPFYVRLARAEVARLREAGFVEAAQIGGNRPLSVLLRHLYPNTLPPLVVQVSLNLGWALLNAAGLSFIGLGIRPPTAEWGIMVADGANFVVSGQWWIALFPGLAIMFTALCFNFLGDGMRDILDPRRRT
jgi:peptide/nickel transport system permease protein